METLTTVSAPKSAQTTTLFVNLFKAIKQKEQKQHGEFMTALDAETDVKSILDKWQYSNLLTKGKKAAIWTLSDIKQYLGKQSVKKTEKAIQKQLDRLLAVEQAGTFEEITFSIEWKKSAMYGSNPNCSAQVNGKQMRKTFESGSVSGCGYDKESTAIAQAANQSNQLLKALYLIKEQSPTADNRELFGYGSGYGILPQLEGGVGVSCYPKIFDKIGYTFNNIASGKTFDVYKVERKN